MRRLLIMLLSLLLCARALAEGGGYVIRVDGEEVRPLRLFGMATRGLGPGEVVQIHGHWITLGDPGTYELRGEAGRLSRVFEDGRSVTIAVNVRRDITDPEKAIINPLAGMTVEERRLIRGVQLGAVDDEVYETLEGLDFSRAAIAWYEDFWDGPREALPRLPSGTQHLVIILQYNLRFGWSEVRDFSSIEALTALRTLVSQGPNSRFDLQWIRKNRRLKHLGLNGQRVLSPDILLRFPDLARLRLGRAAIRDLGHLSKLAHLEALHADFSRVAVLPSEAMPSLRELHVAGAEVSSEEAARFRKLNPACRVYHRWDEIFEERTAETTRIRLLEEDRLVATIDDGAEVRAFLDIVAFSDGRCVDVIDSHLGSAAVLELLSGDVLLGRIVVGTDAGGGLPPRLLVLSWPEELPGDGTLTDESATRVARWIAERGVPELSRALMACRREHAADLRRWRSYERYLPESTFRWFHCGVAPGEVASEFSHAFPDPYRRAQAILLLLGAEQGSWNLAVGLDEKLVTVLLPAVKKHILSRVAVSVATSPAGANGLGRWLFDEGRTSSVDRATLRKILPEVARHCLAHPRRINRQRTMDALARIGGRVARKLLEAVAAGAIPVRVLPEGERGEGTGRPAGWQSDRPGVRDIPDAEYAGERLASLR